MFKKVFKFLINLLPVLLMLALIPRIKNDYYLAGAYVVIIVIAFLIKRERRDVQLFFMGALFMAASEYLFISTGVEVFERNSLFGLMPVWLPILWGYGFVTIKRYIRIFHRY